MNSHSMLRPPRPLPSTLYRPFVTAVLLASLGACGGGGGSSGPPPLSLSLATTTLTFTAANPLASTPDNQTVTGTISGSGSGTLYIVIDESGPAVSVSNVLISGNTGSGTVVPNTPIALGTGTFNSTLTVHVCLNDPTCETGEISGSPKQVAVTYTVGAGPVAANVMPHVVVAGATGQVVIRGSGLSGTTGVSFGGTAASTVTAVSDTEVDATYPATLATGTLPVTLNNGAIPFTGAVVAVAPLAYAATKLNYPATPDHILGMVYDAQRQVLYVAAAMATRSLNQLWVYHYGVSSWGAAQSFTIANLRDVTLSPDGSQVMVLADSSIYTYDPANLSAGPINTVSSAGANGGSPLVGSMMAFAFTNDGNALVASGEPGSTVFAPPYVYTPSTTSFADLGQAYNLFSDDNGDGLGYTPSLAASADGSTVIAGESNGNVLLQYKASIMSMNQVGEQTLPQGEPVAIDANGTRFALWDPAFLYVYDGTFTYLGGEAPQIGAAFSTVLLNPAGTRMYVLTADNNLRTYDVSAAAPGPYFTQLGQAVPQTLPIVTSPILRTAISPDGSTLFVAGDGGVAVIPAPQAQ